MSDMEKPVIEVDFGVRWPTHESFEAAVEAVPRRRKELASVVNLRLRGSSVKSFSFDGTQVGLLMATGDELALVATAAGVDFQLKPGGEKRDSEAAPPEDMRIRFPQGLEYDWQWKSWLRGLLGKEFWAIAPSETTVTLHLRDAPELLFDSLVYLETGKRFLFFSES